MSGDNDAKLRIILEHLAQLYGMPPPPAITPDQLASGHSPFSQLLKVLGIAANSGDPEDTLEAQTGHAERSAKASDALTKFPNNEEASSAQLAGVGNQNPMGQQIPQIISGIAGGIAGAIGGMLQPLAQIPQQAAQAGGQALQAGMGALQHSSVGAEPEGEAIPGELLGNEGATSHGGGDGGVGNTTPTAMLGPLPAPSAGTVPASSLSASLPQPGPAEPQPASRGAMGAMPMMPPGAMQGAAGAGGDPKPDTKRIVGPTVKNGAPVQGRITTAPPIPEVVKRVDGKPIATRRILLPENKRDDRDADTSR